VDLGINTDAVCSIMRADGTILGRKFINFSSDKDHLYHVLGRIRRFQREHSSRQVQSRWDYAKRLNMELSRKIAAEITKYAAEYQADVIVFEYLEMQGKISGKKKQKLHLWRKRDIQKLCEHQAHRNRIRVSRVSARNTSRLACDGSGAVVRNQENHSLCTFRTGKQYNCDLSASYNIGARYFIRELLKPLPETGRSSLEAKVPAVKRRTSCVYADLRKLYVEVNNLKAA
ncbi:IS200/IS605 family accessory protein TnpB-related protein, partial [Clostridium fessum]|uniref:IS200/IS605 family accessory protein TnpB-related protein n=3 Tax=Clostridium TaxID=1485 RepID=UPI003AB5C9FB